MFNSSGMSHAASFDGHRQAYARHDADRQGKHGLFLQEVFAEVPQPLGRQALLHAIASYSGTAGNT